MKNIKDYNDFFLRWLKWTQSQKLRTENIYKSPFYLGIVCTRFFLLDKYMIMLSKVQMHFIYFNTTVTFSTTLHSLLKVIDYERWLIIFI